LKLARSVFVALLLVLPTLARAELKPCEATDLPDGSLCGKINVPLRYENPDGETIELAVIVLPARSGKAAPDPVFFLAGGPGNSTTPSAKFFARDMTRFQQSRDLVLVDLRGTGQSEQFNCDIPLSDTRALIYSFKTSEALAKCAESLDARSTLRTETFARDLDEVRKSLGAEKINLLGASYGTRLALEYARLFPTHTRSLVLRGVSSPSEVIPAQVLGGARHELARLETGTPGLIDKYTALVRQLDEKPVTVSVDGSDVPVDGGLFEGATRFLLYDPRTAQSLPAIVEATTAGSFEPLTQVVAGADPIVRHFSIPVLLGVLCSEDVPFWESIEKGPFDTLRANGIEACRTWSVERVPDEFKEPVTSGAPTLLLSGERDPATPPDVAARIASHLKNSVHAVTPGIGHFPTWTSCHSSIIAAFFERGDVTDIDISCAEASPGR